MEAPVYSMMQPSVAICAHPLAQPLRRHVPVGTPIGALCPAPDEPWLCKLDGQWVLREHWGYALQPGNAVEWHYLTGDRGALRSTLQIGLMVAAAWVTGGGASAFFGWGLTAAQSALAGVAVNVLGNALLNTALPPEAAMGGGALAGQSPSPTYSVALAGNQARLDEPIPDPYGYNRVWPNFAAQPYNEFDDSGDQYYRALLCIGMGRHRIKRVLLDDTPIRNFAGVRYRVFGPGQSGAAPTFVNPAVVTATEVAGQQMLTDQQIGPFAACQPRRQATHIGIDIVCPALGVQQQDGSMGARSIQFRVDVQPIDDFGRPIGDSVQIANETLTASTISPVRRSYKWALPSAMRPQVSITRIDAKDDSATVYDDATWAGLRAYLDEDAELCADATYMEIELKANEQLTGLSQRRIAVVTHRLLRTWSQALGWSGWVETRNPVWAQVHKWLDAATGDGLLESRVDMLTMAGIAAELDARQDHFDYVFDTTMESRRADQIIARVARCVAFERNGVRSWTRDRLVTLPDRVVGARDLAEGWAMSYDMPKSDSAQGIRLRYLDYRSWDWETIDCPMPGHAPDELTRWETVTLPGVVGPKHAEREGKYMAAALLYRRETAAFPLEAEGAMLCINSAIRFAPPMQSWAASGDVVSYDAGTRVMRLTEPLVPAAGSVIVLVDDVGTAGQPIAITAGAEAGLVVLANDPTFTPTTGAADRERTRWLVGSEEQIGRIVRVRRIEPATKEFGAAPQCTITAVVDDDRVHTADLALLPGVGEIQDPVDPGDDGAAAGSSPPPSGGGGGPTPRPYLSGAQGELTITYQWAPGPGVRLTADGRLWQMLGASAIPVGGQWMTVQPVAAEVAALYEARLDVAQNQRWVAVDVGDGSASVLESYTPTLTADSPPTGAWLPISSLTWRLESEDLAECTLSIRLVATGAVQASAYVLLDRRSTTV